MTVRGLNISKLWSGILRGGGRIRKHIISEHRLGPYQVLAVKQEKLFTERLSPSCGHRTVLVISE